jgi:hypothetical protein
MARIVISYRREDTGWITGRIFDRLEAHFGKGNVFMDVDTIPEGVDFRDHIRASLARSDVLLAVIGPDWSGPQLPQKPRIWDASDWVRIEIETALAKPIPVIPILVDRTQLPQPAELPESIHPLVFIQAARVDTQRDFNTHIERLIRRLDELTGKDTVSEGSIQNSPLRNQTSRKSRLRSTSIRVGASIVALSVLGSSAYVLWQRQFAAPSNSLDKQQSQQPAQTSKQSCLNWTPASDGIVPPNTIIGGEEPAWPLFVCRTQVREDVLPGKLIRGWACYVAVDGSEFVSHEYQTLTGTDCPLDWVNAPSGVIPANGFRGGTEAGEPVFVCRANSAVGAGGQQIGRSGWATDHQCVVSYGGKQYRYATFQVLTTPQ